MTQTQLTRHPASIELEAYACGEGAGGAVAAHLAECAACRAHVERLGGLAAPSAADADAIIARALASAEPKEEARTRKGRLWLVTSSVAVPLAAAAAILFLVRSPRPPAPPPERVDHIQHAPMPARTSSASGGLGQEEPDTTFKGSVQLAVVRDRQGDQARFATATNVLVRTGDRLRIEVALDREQAILGGVLADDGSYLELMPLAVRGPGTHFSEKSAKIDPSPTHGTIVVGSPEAIAQVRATRSTANVPGLLTLRVDSEAP